MFEGGRWHLPGGRLLVGERIEEALKRLVRKKTGLEIRLWTGSLLNDLTGIYDDPSRDARERVIALAYLCWITGGGIRPGHNVSEVGVFDRDRLGDLDIAFFDHRQLITDALDKSERSRTRATDT